MTAGRPDPRAAATLLLWVAWLLTTIVGLHALGGALAPPPLTDPGGLNGWIQARKPAEAAFALLRLVALGTAWYLLLATVAGAFARLCGAPAAVRAADMLAVPAVRRLVNAAAGVSVAAVTLTTGAAMASPGTARHYSAVETLAEQTSAGTDATQHLRKQAGGEATEPDTSGGADDPIDHHLDEDTRELPTLRRLPDDEAEPLASTVTPPSSALPAASTLAPPISSTALPPTTAPQDPQMVQWQVQPGQHFWAVAESVLASAWQRPPSDAEIDPYWRHLVDTNRPILRVPGNPDLLYPGQLLTVPRPPPPPSPATQQPDERR